MTEYIEHTFFRTRIGQGIEREKNLFRLMCTHVSGQLGRSCLEALEFHHLPECGRP